MQLQKANRPCHDNLLLQITVSVHVHVMQQHAQHQQHADLDDTEKCVNDAVKVTLNQNQFDALVSFTYNTGTASGKTLFEKLNAKDYTGAADQFLVWDKITDPQTGEKITSKVLSKRRAQERALFLQS